MTGHSTEEGCSTRDGVGSAGTDPGPLVGRRRLIEASGVGGLCLLTAGCTSIGSFGGSGANDGSRSYSATIGSTGVEIGAIPHVVAVREFLSEASDGQFTGTIRNLTSENLQMQALLSGDIGVYTASVGSIYKASIKGNDFRIIGTKLAGTDYVIAVRERVSNLSEFASSDLKMGISGVGALSHVQTVGMLQDSGVDPDAVQFVTIGSSSDRTSALAADKIAGAPLHQSQLRRLLDQDVAVRNAGTVREVFPNYLENTIAVRAGWPDEDGVGGFLEAYLAQVLRANERATNDFDWLYEKVQEYQSNPLPEADAREEWEIARSIDRWPYEELSERGYEDVLSMMDGAGLIDAEAVDIQELIDRRFFDAARERR